MKKKIRKAEKSRSKAVDRLIKDIKRIMRKEKISTYQLADLVGVSQSYVYKVLTSGQSFQLYTLERFAKALGKKLVIEIQDKK